MSKSTHIGKKQKNDVRDWRSLWTPSRINTLLSYSSVAILCITIVLPLIGISTSLGHQGTAKHDYASNSVGSQPVSQSSTTLIGTNSVGDGLQAGSPRTESQRRENVVASVNGYDRDTWAQRLRAGFSQGRARKDGQTPNGSLDFADSIDYSTTASHSMSHVRRQLSLEGTYLAQADRLKRLAEATQQRQVSGKVRAEFVADARALPEAAQVALLPSGSAAAMREPVQRKDAAARKSAARKRH